MKDKSGAVQSQRQTEKNTHTKEHCSISTSHDEDTNSDYGAPLRFFEHPLLVLQFSAYYLHSALRLRLESILQHSLTWYLIWPLSIAYICIPSLRMREFELILWECARWVALGVASSIGFGTGLHTGMLFMFPHIYHICRAVEKCEGYGFDTYGPVAFQCYTHIPSSVNFLATWMKVLPWLVLWGTGTAIGEIPPYAVSYAAARNRPKLAQKISASENALSGAWSALDQMKDWMVKVVRRFGFWGVLLFSAYPNAAFDMCGMACGQSLMPFWVFFTATWLGKAVIKVALQGAFFVALFSGETIAVVLRFLRECFPLAGKYIDVTERVILTTRNSVIANAKFNASESLDSDASGMASFLLSHLFSIIVTICVISFMISILEGWAHEYQTQKTTERSHTMNLTRVCFFLALLVAPFLFLFADPRIPWYN